MIEKMKFLSITGPKNDIDRVMNVYLSKYEIHLENALSELNTVQDLKPFVETNPYREVLARSQELVKKLDPNLSPSDREMTAEEASEIVNKALTIADELTVQKKVLKEEKIKLTDALHQIEPFRMLDYDLNTILGFKFIKFRFGRISHEYYTKFSQYVYENLNTVFLECDSDKDFVWGVYFVPKSSAVKVDAVFSSLHFERIHVPDGFVGTPETVYQSIISRLQEIRDQNHSLSEQIKNKLDTIGPDLLKANNTLSTLSQNHEIRKLAACTKERKQEQVFYILCGWMAEKDSRAFLSEIESDPNVYCISEDGHEDVITKPPTKLRNPKLFKPFEMFINMYGLPAYNEIDPTIFVALTYTLMFGIMFGDVGQGLCLVIGGAVLYHIKKMSLAGIVSLAGIWSTIFGFLYGSIFGFEEWIEPVWRRPMDNIMSTLITAIGFGVVLILIAMVLNIINGIRSKNIEKIFFDQSGVAGIICYSSIILCVALGMTGHALPATIIIVIMIGLPLLGIFLKEPLTRFVKKESHIFPPGGKVMFFVEAFVELFDVVLNYATNTISFVRVGAFALSHAGMMAVVFSLAGAADGNPNIVVVILGNILVTGLEGLIVGIQVLRLEFYEMFSRFYRGTGKEFKPFISKKN